MSTKGNTETSRTKSNSQASGTKGKAGTSGVKGSAKARENGKTAGMHPEDVMEKKGLSLVAAILIGLFVTFILELSNFDILGPVGGWLKYAQFGLFGAMAYVFPVAVLTLLIAATSKQKGKRYVIWGIILFLFVCSFTHLLSNHSLNNRAILTYFKNCADSLSGGGIIGGTIALGLYLMLAQTGAVIINILIMLICLFFLFEDPLKRLFSYIFSNRDEEFDDEYYDEDETINKRRNSRHRDMLAEEPEYYQPAKGTSSQYRASSKASSKRNRNKDTLVADDGLIYSTQHRRAIPRKAYEEPVYVSEDEQGTVIRLVKTRKKHGRAHNAQLIRITKKAQPLRDGSTVQERSGHKVIGVSEQLEMQPHNANGDELHEITQKAKGRTPKRNTSARSDALFANTLIKEPDLEFAFEEENTPSGNGKEAAVTRVKEAAVNRRAKEARPVKVRKGEDQVPGQRSIDDADMERRMQAMQADSAYYAPPMELLSRVKMTGRSSEAELERIARNLEEILEQFGVHVTVTDIQAGPSVTRFELAPELGTRVNKITSLADDLKLNLGVTEIRIEAPIPGRQAVGIEIPNKNRQTVYMRELLEESALINHPSKIAFAAGKDISGNVVVADIAKMPHLLVAGTTGSGKSVFLNTILMTILYRAKPSEVGLIIIDPKQVEFGIYAGIPHLMKDVVTDPGQAVSTLRWAVNEMSNRYQRMKLSAVRDFKSYNAKVEKGTVNPEEENPRKMNQIVIIIDELADLMMVAKKEAESLICRLAQLARAAGIHLIIATQRPSVDVVTGLIKANVPARVALLVSSQIDSRTIIDMPGAEKLLGNGDMLFYPTGYVKPVRIQGAFVSDDEVQRTVDFLIENNKGDYFAAESQEIEKFMSSQPEDGSGMEGGSDGDGQGKYDECFYEAGKLCIEMGKASSSMLQRRFSLGFNRAARIIEQLEDFGVVGPQNGAKPRQILVDVMTFEEMYKNLMDH